MEHQQTIIQSHQYLISCLFSKLLDLTYNISKSKPFLPKKIISDHEARHFINQDIAINLYNKYYINNTNTPSLSNRATINSLSLLTNNTDTNNSNPDHILNNAQQSTYNIYNNDDQKLQNNLSSYSTLTVDTTMCLNCNGQIPTINYLNHIEQCYQSDHVHYEHQHDLYQQLNKDEKLKSHSKTLLNANDILFSTDYHSICYPPNPLEHKMEEQSESDLETISALCPPDINDRRKVISQLIKKKTKYAYKPQQTAPTQHKELEMFHKVYSKMVEGENETISSPPSEEEEEESDYPEDIEDDDVDMDETSNNDGDTPSNDQDGTNNNNTEDSDDEDDDDDIPIAQKLLNQKNNEKNKSKSESQLKPKSPIINNNTNDNMDNYRGRSYNLRTRSPAKPIKRLPTKASNANQSPNKKVSTKSEEKKTNHEPINNANNNINTSSLTKKQKYRMEYNQLTKSFKNYHHHSKIHRLKKKQKVYLKRREDKDKGKVVVDFIDRYSIRIQQDKQMIKEIYDIISKDSNIERLTRSSRYPLSINYSKQLLSKLINCNIKTKHCGFIYEEPQQINSKQENKELNKDNDEEKTMRMEVDHQTEQNNDTQMSETKEQQKDKEDDEEIKLEYYCHKKLNKNGVCPDHKNWRIQKYQSLINKLKKEIEQLFLLKCISRQIKQEIKYDSQHEKYRNHLIEYDLRRDILKNDILGDMDLLNSNRHLIDAPSLKIKDESTDIHNLLLQASIQSNQNENQGTIEKNALFLPI